MTFDFKILFKIKVLIKLYGDLNETEIRVLNEEQNKSVLKTSSMDTFILSVNKYKKSI